MTPVPYSNRPVMASAFTLAPIRALPWRLWVKPSSPRSAPCGPSSSRSVPEGLHTGAAVEAPVCRRDRDGKSHDHRRSHKQYEQFLHLHFLLNVHLSSSNFVRPSSLQPILRIFRSHPLSPIQKIKDMENMALYNNRVIPCQAIFQDFMPKNMRLRAPVLPP